MKNHVNRYASQARPVRGPAVGALTAAALLSAPGVCAQDEYDELSVIIEINASDGDAGFHAKFDGGPWQWTTIRDPNGGLIFFERARGRLRQQGLTENFFESAEPPCFFDHEDPEADPDEVVTVADFLERFPAGEYRFAGKKTDRGFLAGEATFTHNLPAAPDIGDFDGATGQDPDNTIISWALGNDLGECDVPASIPDPGAVPVVRWEIVVEPGVDELPAGMPESVFSVQLPGDVTSVLVPPNFLKAYADVGVTEFKFEVGAKEESGNQTFSEGEFDIADPL